MKVLLIVSRNRLLLRARIALLAFLLGCLKAHDVLVCLHSRSRLVLPGVRRACVLSQLRVIEDAFGAHRHHHLVVVVLALVAVH